MVNPSRIESELQSKLPSGLAEIVSRAPKPQSPSQSGLSTGIPEIDESIGTLPRGAITVASGPAFSGRTTMMLSALRSALWDGELCCLVDANDAFDVRSADEAGLDLDRMLWVRCNNQVQNAFSAAEIVLQSAAFSLVVLDVCGISDRDRQLIPDSSWFRFRRAVENTPTSLLVIAPRQMSPSCAALSLEFTQAKACWAGGPEAVSFASPLLGFEFTVKRRKPFLPKESAPIKAALSYALAE
jgi:recombination protein RecA